MRRLVICSTCRFSPDSKLSPDGRTGGEVLADTLRAVVSSQDRPEVIVETQACLWNCTRPCSVAIQDDDRFSYITGGHEPSEAQARAIIAWFDLHGETPDGVVPFRAWPQAMRGHFIARLPPVMR